ncbi:hypothetical protein EJB05_29515, partial [Eragrostis curvula]
MCSASPFLHSATIPARSISARLLPSHGPPSAPVARLPLPQCRSCCLDQQLRRAARRRALGERPLVEILRDLNRCVPAETIMRPPSRRASASDPVIPWYLPPSLFMNTLLGIMVWSKNQNNDPSTSRGSKPKNNMIIMYTAKFHDIEDSSWLSLELNSGKLLGIFVIFGNHKLIKTIFPGI